MTQTETYERARSRAEAKYKFYVHLAIYVVVMTFLVVLNRLTAPETLWSIWPLLGWGLAVALHGARVFFLGGRHAIVDALTERELNRSPSHPRDQ